MSRTSICCISLCCCCCCRKAFLASWVSVSIFSHMKYLQEFLKTVFFFFQMGWTWELQFSGITTVLFVVICQSPCFQEPLHSCAFLFCLILGNFRNTWTINKPSGSKEWSCSAMSSLRAAYWLPGLQVGFPDSHDMILWELDNTPLPQWGARWLIEVGIFGFLNFLKNFVVLWDKQFLFSMYYFFGLFPLL